MVAKRINFSTEQAMILDLLEKISPESSKTLRRIYEKKEIERVKKAKKRTKFLRKGPRKRQERERERLRLDVLPQVIHQAMLKGIPLREPKRKKNSAPEITPLLSQTLVTSPPLLKPLEITDKLKQIPFDSCLESDVVYVPDLLYLQRLDNDPSKMIVKMVVNWGYLEEDRLPLFLNEQTEEQSENLIIVFRSDKTLHGIFPMHHATHFQNDEEETAKPLFVGLITGLEPNSKYYYRLECYTRKNRRKLFAATNNIAFRTAFTLKDDNAPLFLTVSSDLHGGHGAKFLRGKVAGKNIAGNLELARVFNGLVAAENEATFQEGYALAVTTGDLTDNASYTEYWFDLFKRCSVLWNHVPLLTSIGNHDYYCGGHGKGNVVGGLEEDCRYFHRFITNPNGGSGGNLPEHWYAIEFGNVFAIFLDTNGLGWGKYEIACGTEQWHWLEAELQNWRKRQQMDPKTPQFCFVFLHSAIMSLGFWGRGFNWGNDEKVQSYLTPLFRKYGVDMVFCGHDHIYQRSSWMGTVYLQNGRYGGSTRPYFFWKKRQTVYDIEEICEQWSTRIYTSLYVPPHKEFLTEEQRKKFEVFKQRVKKALLKQPTASNFYFGSRRLNQKIGGLFDQKPTLKAKLIDELILPKLEDHVWLRAYAIEKNTAPQEREVIDMFFLPAKKPEEVAKNDYVLVCPEKVVE